MIRAIIAFLASALTAIQASYIYFKGQTICFNNGCAIVDSMTAVSPLYFNIAGLLFFQVLFWCLLWGRDGSEFWHKFARMLLLAGLCCESVLVFFQYSIVKVFCSYCLVILAFIVLLNLLSGMRQILRGVVLFSAIMIACFSLQFRGTAGAGASLDSGSMSMVTGEKNEARIYLFFSSTCTHCEKVIEALREENICTIRFNPIERIDNFSFPGTKKIAKYNPEINLNFMNSLSIEEIPVLVVVKQENIFVLRGEQQIREYLDETCRKTTVIDYSGTSSAKPTEFTVLPEPGNQEDDACSVTEGCDTKLSGGATKKE